MLTKQKLIESIDYLDKQRSCRLEEICNLISNKSYKEFNSNELVPLNNQLEAIENSLCYLQSYLQNNNFDEE